MRSSYKILNPVFRYFITSTIINWIPVFNNENNIDALINAIIFNQKSKNLKIYAYVIMPEHFHLICQSNDITSALRSIKSFTAKKIIEYYSSEKNQNILKEFSNNKKNYKETSKYQVWQEGFMPKEIVDNKMYMQKIEYIHYNPVKRGLVEKEEEYNYSSVRDYFFGKPGRIIIDELKYSK